MIAGPDHVEHVPELAALGFLAYTTTRAFGSMGTATNDPVRDVMARWQTVLEQLRGAGVPRLATASQVHGARVVVHRGGWEGWLRLPGADGHACEAGSATAAAVTVADCVPVFLAHPSGALALLHSGWRGTEARIVEAGIDALAAAGCRPGDLVLHLGPAICGRCYEVSPDVYGRLTGRAVDRPTPVDLRSLIAAHARSRGVRTISVSALCTKCHGDRLFSHRGGDVGRQISVMAAVPAHFA
ncbi:MAG TPA: polyphenol oxidase family protein [Gemmatimonadaceae bacterium]|nr:polyphenol oxidase family protein [Gemmatimonadaceae bacterium]